MKIFFFSLFFAMPLFSQTLSWRGNYDKAHQEALYLHKPLLVLVAKANDPGTNRVLRTVFMHQPYIKELNTRAVAVMVTYEGDVSYPVEMYYTTVFPALFLVNEKELFLIDPIYGDAITPESVKRLVKTVSKTGR